MKDVLFGIVFCILLWTAVAVYLIGNTVEANALAGIKFNQRESRVIGSIYTGPKTRQVSLSHPNCRHEWTYGESLSTQEYPYYRICEKCNIFHFNETSDWLELSTNPYAPPLAKKLPPITGTWTEVYDCNDIETIQTWNLIVLRSTLVQIDKRLDALEKKEKD